MIILPKKSADELIENEDVKTVNVGLIYIGDTYLDEYQTNDYISRTKFKFKLTHSIAKQLTKHWFQQSNDFHCDSMHIYANEQEQLFADNLRTIKNYCPQLRNCSYNDQPLATIDDSNATNNSATARFVINDLHLFEKCYFYKSIVNWISYLAFQSIYPQLFDLVIIFNRQTLINKHEFSLMWTFSISRSTSSGVWSKTSRKITTWTIIEMPILSTRIMSFPSWVRIGTFRIF